MKTSVTRLRRAVAERALADDDGTGKTACAYCGHPLQVYLEEEGPIFVSESHWHEEHGYLREEPAHLDHIIPEYRNGPTSLDNTVIVCPPCNYAKGAEPFGDPGFLLWLADRRVEVIRRRLIEAQHRERWRAEATVQRGFSRPLAKDMREPALPILREALIT